MTERINRGAFVPPYFQLAQILENKILSGELKPGDSLPSEADLGKQYDLSRMTVRKCLNILAERGLVSAQPGRGTFISRPVLDKAVFTVEEFQREMNRRGLTPGARTVDVRVTNASQEIAQILDVSTEDKILYFSRLLTANNSPIALERKYMRYNIGHPILENELQYMAFAEIVTLYHDVLPVRSRMLLRADLANEDDARHLQIPQHSPVLCIEQSLYTGDGKTVGWGLFVYRADKFTIVSEIEPLKGVE